MPPSSPLLKGETEAEGGLVTWLGSVRLSVEGQDHPEPPGPGLHLPTHKRPCFASPLQGDQVLPRGVGLCSCSSRQSQLAESATGAQQAPLCRAEASS